MVRTDLYQALGETLSSDNPWLLKVGGWRRARGNIGTYGDTLTVGPDSTHTSYTVIMVHYIRQLVKRVNGYLRL